MAADQGIVADAAFETHQKLPPIQADWRERLLRILQGNSISERERESAWRVWGGLGTFLLCFALLKAIPNSLFGNAFESAEGGVVVGIVSIWILYIWAVLCYVHPFVRRFRGRALQRRSRNASEVLRKALSPPVLFLRAFHSDQIVAPVPIATHLFELPFPTQEEKLTRLLAKYAPVIAIGRPGEALPPLGAARFYVNHALWKERVADILPLCSLIVWTTGVSPGLRWEIDRVRRSVDPRRLLLRVNAHLGDKSPLQQQAEWGEFVKCFAEVFPGSLNLDFDKSEFIAFTNDWAPLAVKMEDLKRAKWPLFFWKPDLETPHLRSLLDDRVALFASA